MQKHPLLSVKQAAELLRLDERSVRERLINGQLKGEKKNVGLREKWFVYSGAIEAALAKQQGGLGADAVESADIIIDATPGDDEPQREAAQERASNEDVEEWIDINRDKVKVLAEEIVKPLMEKIEAQAELIFEQKRTITDQDRQLRLLPDLQKQAEVNQKDVELKHVENEALKKQVAALQEQVEASKRSWWKKLFGSSDNPTV